MTHGGTASESRFAAYVEALSSAVGHADRKAPLKAYCTGLLLPGERKSVEPMAARVAPGRVQAAHQSLHHFVAKAEWSDAALLAVVRAQVLPVLERQGAIRAWIGSLRGSRLARLPPPRHARHRRLRIPGLRVESDSPLSLAPRAARQSASPTQELPTPRRRRSVPNATSPTRSPPSALDSRAPWCDGCPDVLAANDHL